MQPGGRRVRRRRLEPWIQRLRRLLRRAQGGFEKRQRVYMVEVGGVRLKQIVLPDACVAGEIAANLEALDATGVFPRLIARYRNELWVEFIEGAAFAHNTTPSSAQLAELFAPIYRRASHAVPFTTLPLIEQLRRDLELLEGARALDGRAARSLAATLPALAPREIWLGYDYGDARAQNILRVADGRLRIIDVESIRRDAPVGIGVVRALLRWPGVDREDLFTQLESRSVPDFRRYMAFLEIVFLATWTKRCVLQGKSTRQGGEGLARIASGAR